MRKVKTTISITWAKKGIAMMIGFALMLTGCSNYDVVVEEKAPEEATVLNLGIVPSESPMKLIEQWKPFSDYIAEVANIDLRIIPVETYTGIYNQIQSGLVDVGIFGSYGAAKGIRDYGLVPMARPVKIDGRSVYHGEIFVRKDSGIKDIAGLENKSFAYVSNDTSAGYFFPRDEIKKLGKNPDTFFSKVLFSGRHDLAIDTVMEGKTVGGAAKDEVYYSKTKENPRIGNELAVIGESVDFPDRTFLMNPTLSSIIFFKLKDAMLTMHENEKGRATLAQLGFTKFIETKVEDFKETLMIDVE